MNTIPTNAEAKGYRLKSEMARVCLPAPQARVQRRLAWTNSICLLFLIVGVVGFRPTPSPPPKVKPLEPSVVEIVEPAPPPPPSAEVKPEDEPKDTDKSDAPKFVAVTPDSPAISFSVPTIGNVLVPNAVAVAPPAAPLRHTIAMATAPAALENTGRGGERPAPAEYPPLARQLGQQGRTVLLLTVDEAGLITSAEAQESSGSSILDHFSVTWVKRHWTLAPGPSNRLFLAPFEYRLNSK